MEADWEVEVGGEAPVIDALWPGLVDLRLHPECAIQLPEAIAFPALAETLAVMNGAASPVWTAKCDFWPAIGPGEFDPDELDAPGGCAEHASGCYIDLLPKGDHEWTVPTLAASWCKGMCVRIGAVPLRSSRVDLIVRRAFVLPEQMDFGVTAYLTACGSTTGESHRTLQLALASFAGAIVGSAAPEMVG